MLGVVSAFHPHWVADAMRWMVALIAAPVLFWAANDLDARRLPPHLHAGDQPPDPELAGQARAAPARRPTSRSRSAALIAIGLVAADQRQAAGRDLRLRRDAGDHDRPPLDHPPAGHRARPAAPLPDPLERPPGAAPSCRSRRWSRRCVSGLAFLSVLAFHDDRPLGRRSAGWPSASLFYVVYRKVFEGTSLTKRVSVDRAGADQAGPRGRLPQHPGAGLRHQARRRHRRHRRPPRRRRARGRRRRGASPGSTSST